MGLVTHHVVDETAAIKPCIGRISPPAIGSADQTKGKQGDILCLRFTQTFSKDALRAILRELGWGSNVSHG